MYIDEVISNDPRIEGEEFLKTWESPIGSLRQIHGGQHSHVQIVVSINWERLKVTLDRIVVKDLEDDNSSDEFSNPLWNKIETVHVKVHHRCTFEHYYATLLRKYSRLIHTVLQV